MNNLVKNNKTYVWIIIVLILLNVSTISTIFYNNYQFNKIKSNQLREDARNKRPEFFMERHRNDVRDFEEHHRFMKEFRGEAGKITREMHQKRIEMLDLLSKESPDTLLLKNLAEEFGILHRDLKLLTIDFYLKTKEVSTPEQQAELYRYFHHMLQRDDRDQHHPRRIKHKAKTEMREN